MLVVLPSFRRLETLAWSLHSVLRAGLPGNEPARLCVVSNYPPSHAAVEELAAQAVQQHDAGRRWELSVLKRPQTLPPVENWYSAIRTQARPNETVFLHGDDDIMMPWGLEKRCQALARSGASILLSHAAGDVIYDRRGRCHPSGVSFAVSGRFKMLDWSSVELGNAPFLGNSCYRLDERFLAALKLAFEWCEKMDWLDVDTRTAMLPYYLPMAALEQGTPVAALDAGCVMRGCSMEELISAPYACRGWNEGLLCAVALLQLSSPPLEAHPELARERAVYARSALAKYAGMLCDGRVDARSRDETLRRLGPRLRGHRTLRWLGGLAVAKEHLGLRRLTVRLRVARRRRMDVPGLLAAIDGNAGGR